MKNAAELAGVYAMFVVVLAKSNVSDFEAPELFVIHPADDPLTILDVVGYLLTNLCRVEKLLLDEWVFGFFSRAPNAPHAACARDRAQRGVAATTALQILALICYVARLSMVNRALTSPHLW